MRPRILATAFVGLLLAAAAVDAQPPVASFRIDPAEPEAGQLVNFTSTSTAGAAPLTQWVWSFGDGATGEGETVSHAFAAGDYIVTLVVTDAQGQSAEQPSLVAIVAPTTVAPVEEATASSLPAWLFWLMPFLVALILFAMAYLVVAKGQPAIYNKVFLLFYVTSGVKSLAEAGIALMAGYDPQPWLETVARVAAYLQVAMFLWFVLVFPRPIVHWLHDGRRGAVILLLAVPFLVIEFGGLLSVAASVDLFNIFAVTVAVASLGLLLWHSRETDSQEERSRIRWLAFTFLLLVASAVVVAILHLAKPGAVITIMTGFVIVPALEVVGALILLYAILRYQLLGIEGLVLRLTRGAVIALTVPSLFITIGNSVEAVFEATVLAGVKFSFLIAGFISALLMVPVQKWVTFLLHRWLPALDREAEESAQRRREIFEAQLRYCLLDGALKPKEVTTLRKLAASLGMPRTELLSVTKRFPGVDGAALAASVR